MAKCPHHNETVEVDVLTETPSDKKQYRCKADMNHIWEE